MNMSLSSKSRGAMGPAERSHPGDSDAMSIAIVAALVIEAALVAAVMSTHAPTVPPHVPPVMHVQFVDTVKPLPPPPPPRVIKKIVKRQSDRPMPKPVVQPAPPVERRAPAPKVAPVPIAAQDAPSNAQALPSAPAPAAAAAPGPTNTAGPAEQADITIVCPVQAKPEMPARALADGISGAVTARATIKGGKVVHVDIVKATPPGVFDASVRRAMALYQCKVDGDDDVVVEQSFDFTETD